MECVFGHGAYKASVVFGGKNEGLGMKVPSTGGRMVVRMSKKSVTQRDLKRRELVAKYSEKRADTKEKLRKCANVNEAMEIQKQFQKLPRDSAEARLHSRCGVTGRPRGNCRLFGLSRHVMREQFYLTSLPGFTKASW